jgi:adenylate cyclase
MWQQFRRRRVIRVLIAYAACSFAAVQAALFLLPGTTLPEWSLRAVWGVVVMGFPFAVVLAWTYDITAGRIVRTPDELGPEPANSPADRKGWIVVTLVALAAGLLLRSLRS